MTRTGGNRTRMRSVNHKTIGYVLGTNTRQAAAGQLALPPWSKGNDSECFKPSFMI